MASEKAKKLIDEINDLGRYRVEYGTSNKDKPNQQLHIFKKDGSKVIAKVSLVLACRVNTLFNGIGRKDTKLLDLLTEFSKSI